MFAGEMVTLVFFSLVPVGFPSSFEGLHVGVAFIQTYIFVLLPACIWERRQRMSTKRVLSSQFPVLSKIKNVSEN